MKPPLPRARDQSGIILLGLLVVLIIAGSYAFYRSANVGYGSQAQDSKLALRLAKAKEALIAYAVIDDKRPGRMPCPDVIGDGISPLLTRDDCDGWTTGGLDIYTGKLPWKTLDVADGTDDQGLQFHYVTSRFFAGDRRSETLNRAGVSVSPALNSDTPFSQPDPKISLLPVPTGLVVDGSEVVALIIATRGALDTKNADGDALYFNGTAREQVNKNDPDNNDMILAVTRQELMAAVEKRVAGEVKNCLEQHAASAPDATYPWPAPLSNSIFKGQAKTLFGMVPATQPGGNPDELLKQINQELEAAKDIFATTLSPNNVATKFTALLQLQTDTFYASLFYDRLYIVATDLYNQALLLSTAFDTLDNSLGLITKNSAAFLAGADGIPAAIVTAQPTLDNFRFSLANSGFDIFLIELLTENTKLLSKIALATSDPSNNMTALQTQANVFKSKLLANSLTPNIELTASLTNGIALASLAVDHAKAAKAAPNDLDLVTQAINSASALAESNRQLAQMISTIRLQVDPMSVDMLNEKLTQSLETFVASGDTNDLPQLSRWLDYLQSEIEKITQGSNAVMLAKAYALSRLALAEASIKATPSPAPVELAVRALISDTQTLIGAMENNGDNIVQSTLKIVADLLNASQSMPPNTLTAGKDLQALAKLVTYWAGNTASYSKSIAQAARKKPDAENDSAGSAFTAAKSLLNSLDGSTGSIELLQNAANNPGDAAAQRQAQTALNKTQSLLEKLSTKSGSLESDLESGLADAAIPTKWPSSSCSFLMGHTGNDTWWSANRWSDYIFYQTNDHYRSLPVSEPCVGKLTVNSAGTSCVVAISAGRAINDPSGPDPLIQNRSNRTIKNYLDNPINADSSRDGDARNPGFNFSTEPVQPKFNDRLAY